MTLTAERQKVLDEARTWLGTPFHHRAKVKQVGVDCVNFIVEVYQAVDPKFRPVIPLYGRQIRHGGTVFAEVEKYFRRVPEALIGDLGVFSITPDRDQHLAIFTDYGLIHCDGTVGVTEHGFCGQWPDRLLGTFRLPSLEEAD